MSRHNPYDNRLIWFRDYIKHGLDPYDFSHLLPEYADWYEGQYDEPVPNLDLDDPETFLAAENADEFRTWLEKVVEHTRIDEAALLVLRPVCTASLMPQPLPANLDANLRGLRGSSPQFGQANTSGIDGQRENIGTECLTGIASRCG